jgi:hypothetical protein
MGPKTIICDGRSYEGEICGGVAIVQRIDYAYGAIPDPDGNSYTRVLRETRRRILCPKCGPRLQVEQAEDLQKADAPAAS